MAQCSCDCIVPQILVCTWYNVHRRIFEWLLVLIRIASERVWKYIFQAVMVYAYSPCDVLPVLKHDMKEWNVECDDNVRTFLLNVVAWLTPSMP